MNYISVKKWCKRILFFLKTYKLIYFLSQGHELGGTFKLKASKFNTAITFFFFCSIPQWPSKTFKSFQPPWKKGLKISETWNFHTLKESQCLESGIRLRGVSLLRKRLEHKGVHWLMVTWVAAGWPAKRQAQPDMVHPAPPQLLVTKHGVEAEGFLRCGEVKC